MTIHDQLQEVFQTVFADDTIELKPETTASDIPQWDSVAHINLMFAIEQSFGIQFAGNELAEFANIGELEQYLEQRKR